MSKTRRAQGEGNIRKLTVTSKGKQYTYWQGRITTDAIDRKTGKHIIRNVTGKTQREVVQKLHEIAVNQDEKATANGRIKLSAWLDIWAKNYLVAVKPSTKRLYEQKIRLYINPELGNVRLCDLTGLMIQEVVAEYTSKEKENTPQLSAKTIKDTFSVLRSALEQAVELRYIPFNPMKGVKLPCVSRTARKIYPMREDQIAEYVKAIRGHRHEELFTMALLTGMREGELLGLQWENVDLFNGTITVRQQLVRNKEKGGKYSIETTKNDRIRVVHIGMKGIKTLEDQQMKIRAMKSIQGKNWTNHDLVFPNETGGFLSYRTVYDCHKRIARKIGAPNTRFHDLRHTYATVAIKSGVDLKTIQEMLGHSEIDTTLNIYGHVYDSMKTSSAVKVETFYDAVL